MKIFIHKVVALTLAAVAFSFATSTSVLAQPGWGQTTACPGWNNPTSFTFGTTNDLNESNYGFHGWAGRTGVKASQAPNVLTGSTSITWGAAIPAMQMASKTMNPAGDCANVPEMTIGGVTVSSTDMRARAFTIMDSTTQYTGFPANVDPNTVSSAAQAANGLRYVPTQYNIVDTTDPAGGTNFSKSIRIGHACGRQSGSDNASAAYYYMNVTPQNAMMYIYYAAVFENPYHDQFYNPVFIIRVMRQNVNGQWVQASPTGIYPSGSSQCDTLAYMQTITASQIQSTPGYNTSTLGAWHSYSSFGYTGFWKDWTKVALNLTNLMYNRVRIEVMVSSCSMVQHYGYAYIAGECRPMQISINGSGLASDMSPCERTLSAPRGMQNYVWYASDHGAALTTMDYFAYDSLPESARYFRWRQLTPDVGTEAQGANVYQVQQGDYVVHYRPNAAHNPNILLDQDSVVMMQAFRCRMTSALDPTKPYESDLYVHVSNVMCNIEYDTVCDSAYVWNGQVITTTGTYSAILTGSNGFDSIANLHIVFNTPQNTEETVSACESYVWQGTTYTAGGDYTAPIVDANGCNATATLHLTINNTSLNIDSVEVPDYYQWRSEFYFRSGTYTDTLIDANGCDSVLMLILHVQNGCDTVYIHDTLYRFIHDTIYDTIYVGMDEVDAISAKIYVNTGQIVVEGVEGDVVGLFDASGRLLATKQDVYSTLRFDVPAPGTYFVRIGNRPSRKVVVFK